MNDQQQQQVAADDEGMNGMSSTERDFRALCETVEKNDPAVTVVDLSALPLLTFTNVEARRLGTALHGNSHVTFLSFNLSYLADFQGTDDDGDEGDDAIVPLLRFFSESSALKVVCMADYDCCASVTVLRRFFLAMAESSAIQELTLDCLDVHPEGLDTLLQTTRTLMKLTLHWCDWGANAVSHELVAAAMGANQTLECLVIENSSRVDLATPVLWSLGPHPRIRSVRVDCGTSLPSTHLVDAMTYFTSTSKTLELFEMSEFCWNKSTLEAVVKGIQSNPQVTSVSFDSCIFALESTVVFRDLLLGYRSVGVEQPAVDLMDDILQMNPCSLTTLTIRSCHFHDAASVNEVAEAIGSSSSTANSTLHSLTIENSDEVDLVEPVLEHLGSHFKLRKLTLNYGRHASVSRNLLRAMRRNGSLHTVVLLGEPPNVVDEPTWKLVQCYCERNQCIPIVVANPRFQDDQNDVEAVVGIDVRLPNHENHRDRTYQYLFPTLFAAAMQAPRIAPNTLLVGLCALGDLVGPPIGTVVDWPSTDS